MIMWSAVLFIVAILLRKLKVYVKKASVEALDERLIVRPQQYAVAA